MKGNCNGKIEVAKNRGFPLPSVIAQRTIMMVNLWTLKICVQAFFTNEEGNPVACDPLCDKLTPHSPCRGPCLTVSKHADRIWNVGAFEEIAICQHKHYCSTSCQNRRNKRKSSVTPFVQCGLQKSLKFEECGRTEIRFMDLKCTRDSAAHCVGLYCNLSPSASAHI